MLTKSILKNISTTDITFKDCDCKEIDLIIGGGGFNGFYVFGFNKILKKLEREEKLKIQRYAGTSVGAIVGVNIKDRFYIGYSYAYPLNALNKVSIQSHELALRLKFNKAVRTADSPRFFN
jgi:hypothetical protein